LRRRLFFRKMSEQYKSEVKYITRGPYETMRDDMKDWRDHLLGKG